MSASRTTKNLADPRQRLLADQLSLNILRAHRLGLNIQEGVVANSQFLEEVTFEKLMDQVDTLRSLISHLMNKKQAIVGLKANRAYGSYEDAVKSSAEIKEAVSEVVGLSSTLVTMRNVDDQEFYQLKLLYSKSLVKYAERLSKENEGKMENISFQEKENKVKRIVKKLNMTRVLTQMLIAAFVTDYEAYPEINEFRSSIRRDLVWEEFKDTWDVGLDR